MLRWLEGKVPVPGILAYAAEDGTSYLLMERCAGEMACTEGCLKDPDLLCRLLSNCLKTLWAVDIADCPCDQSLDRKLAQARYNVEHGLVDLGHVEPDTFGPYGFRAPPDLLRWLENHRPTEERALIHGDLCLPNLFGQGDQPAGFIDLGRGGVGDPWCDIAIGFRSLQDNLSGRYGGPVFPALDPGLFFRALGITPDWDKIRYYTLLDELF